MKIFIIGDSISIHYDPYLKTYLSGICEYSRKEGTEEALKDLDIPSGANGGDSSMVLRYLESKFNNKDIDADIILINCGLHDIKCKIDSRKMQISISEYEENLKKIIKLIEKNKTKLIWITTTPFDEETHNKVAKSFKRYNTDTIEYNSVSNKIMNEFKIPSIDLYSFTKNLGNNTYCDHVHFNEETREKQAAFIAGFLNNYLQKN